jgi:hypothetical protein
MRQQEALGMLVISVAVLAEAASRPKLLVGSVKTSARLARQGYLRL